MLNFLTVGLSWMALHWWLLFIICGLGAVAGWKWRPETDEARSQRAQRRQKKESRALADKILMHGRKVHQRYPTGDVVVSEHDLAEELRKQPDTVATALNLLLGERRVKRAPLEGYWKLNV